MSVVSHPGGVACSSQGRVADQQGDVVLLLLSFETLLGITDL